MPNDTGWYPSLGASNFNTIVNDISYVTQAEKGMVAANVLCCMAASIQNLVIIETPQKFKMNACMQIAVAAGSGERKSAHDKICMSPFKTSRKEIHGSIKKSAKEEDSKHGENPVLLPQIIIENSTHAALVQELQEFNSVYISTAEGENFVKSEIASKTATLNSIFSGESISFSTKQNGQVYLDDAKVSLKLLCQPVPLKHFFSSKGLTENGALARCIVYQAPKLSGTRRIVIPDENCDGIQLYEGLIKDNLLCSYNNPQMITVKLTTDAAGLSLSTLQSIENEMGPGGRFENCNDHASKLGDNIFKVALCMARFENPEAQSINVQNIRDAIDLVFFYSNSYRQHFVPPTKFEQNYLLLCKWFNKKVDCGQPILSKSYLLQYGPKSLRWVDKLNPILEYMLNRREIYIQPVFGIVFISLRPSTVFLNEYNVQPFLERHGNA
nr:DUF3987 domain-containing protein [Alteromonas sp. 5E99-2]